MDTARRLLAALLIALLSLSTVGCGGYDGGGDDGSEREDGVYGIEGEDG